MLVTQWKFLCQRITAVEIVINSTGYHSVVSCATADCMNEVTIITAKNELGGAETPGLKQPVWLAAEQQICDA